MKWRLFAAGLVTLILLRAQINAPSPGSVRYGDKSVRMVYGIPGNLMLAPSSFDTADALDFSELCGMTAKNGRIELLRPDHSSMAAYTTGETAPVLYSESGPARAMAWLPGEHALLVWNGVRWNKLAVDDPSLSGTVTSIASASEKSARLVVTNSDGSVAAVAVSLTSGAVVAYDLLPGIEGPAYTLGGFVISADENGLEIDRPNGQRETLPFAPVRFSAERMSSHWLHLYSTAGRQDWALHVSAAPATISMLPEPAAVRTHAAAAAGTAR